MSYPHNQSFPSGPVTLPEILLLIACIITAACLYKKTYDEQRAKIKPHRNATTKHTKFLAPRIKG